MQVVTDPGVNVPALLFGGLTVIFAVFTVWFGVETFLLARGEHPITWFTRNYVSWHLWGAMAVAVVIALAVGMGVTHFVFDEAVHP